MPIYPRQASLRNYGGAPGVPGLVQVPKQLLPNQNSRYPSDNAHTFERWFMDMYRAPDARTRLYLPIQWTALYCNGRYGQDKSVIQNVQAFLKTLDTSKKYYTIVQYDDGILNDLTGLDIKVLGMSGGHVDYPLPLLCMPHTTVQLANDLVANFVGNNTHPIRAEMMKELKGRPRYYLSNVHHPLPDYCQYIARSLFTLAPRGYGPTSFRIMEAIHAGSVPVYISDKHLLPFNLPFNYGLLLQPGDDIGTAIATADYPVLKANLKKVMDLFTYKGAKTQLLTAIDSI